MANRQAFIDEALKWVSKIIPKSEYIDVLKKQLEDMSDKDFAEYAKYLEESGDSIPIVVPNLSSVKIEVGRNLKVAKQLGYDFFQHLELTDPVTGLTYKTPIKYFVIRLPFRRQQQMLDEKSSIPDTNRFVDDLSGQPSGPSKGSSMTYPEIQVLRSQGAYKSLEEMIKYRGGDTKGFQAMNRQIMETGGVSIDALNGGHTTVKSTTTLSTYLLAMHIDNNL